MKMSVEGIMRIINIRISSRKKKHKILLNNGMYLYLYGKMVDAKVVYYTYLCLRID